MFQSKEFGRKTTLQLPAAKKASIDQLKHEELVPILESLTVAITGINCVMLLMCFPCVALPTQIYEQ